MKEIIKKIETPVQTILFDKELLPLTMYYAFLPFEYIGAYIYVLDIRDYDIGKQFTFRDISSDQIWNKSTELRDLIGDALCDGQVFVFDNFLEYQNFVIANTN